jgi:gliding motility-associated-like protein
MTTNGNYVFTPTAGQCAAIATLAVSIPSFTYSITQECVDNKYLIKAVSNTNSLASDYTYTWINDKGDQIEYNSPTFNFTEYLEKLNDKPVLPLQFKVIVSYGSCEIEETFEVTDNLCGIPNTISPNGDGINDDFNLSSLNVNNLTIFNRYGREVYRFAGKYNNQWHGQWEDGILPTGTYYYTISSENGDRKAGWIFLSY